MSRGATHELKICSRYFDAILDGKKGFEIRHNDRNYHIGDTVILKEWGNNKFSGREIHAVIDYLLDDKFVGLSDGYVAFQLGIFKIIDR